MRKINDDVYEDVEVEYEGKKYIDTISIIGAKNYIKSCEDPFRKGLMQAFLDAITKNKQQEATHASKTNKPERASKA